MNTKIRTWIVLDEVFTEEEINEALKYHRQAHELSCLPSAMEMILKIKGLLDRRSTFLQDEFSTSEIGILDNSHPNGIMGLQFRRISIEIIDENGEKEILDQIEDEISNNKMVIAERWYNCDGCRREGPGVYCVHAHVVFDIEKQQGNKIFHTVTSAFSPNGNGSSDPHKETFRMNEREFLEHLVKPEKMAVIWTYGEDRAKSIEKLTPL